MSLLAVAEYGAYVSSGRIEIWFKRLHCFTQIFIQFLPSTLFTTYIIEKPCDQNKKIGRRDIIIRFSMLRFTRTGIIVL